MAQSILRELSVMQQVADITSTLTPNERMRVAAWFYELASQDETPQAQALTTTAALPPAQVAAALAAAPEQDAAADAEADAPADAPAEKTYDSFAAFYAAAAPRKGAQKAAVAGYWLETREAHESWKASEVNKLLKSIDVKVSSMSIVLTNAVKVESPLVEELGRLGDSERSRKTFKLTDQGRAYVEAQLA